MTWSLVSFLFSCSLSVQTIPTINSLSLFHSVKIDVDFYEKKCPFEEGEHSFALKRHGKNMTRPRKNICKSFVCFVPCQMSLVLGQKFLLFTGKDYDSLRVKASEAAPLFVSAGFTKERKRAVFKHWKKNQTTHSKET